MSRIPCLAPPRKQAMAGRDEAAGRAGDRSMEYHHARHADISRPSGTLRFYVNIGRRPFLRLESYRDRVEAEAKEGSSCRSVIALRYQRTNRAAAVNAPYARRAARFVTRLRLPARRRGRPVPGHEIATNSI